MPIQIVVDKELTNSVAKCISDVSNTEEFKGLVSIFNEVLPLTQTLSPEEIYSASSPRYQKLANSVGMTLHMCLMDALFHISSVKNSTALLNAITDVKGYLIPNIQFTTRYIHDIYDILDQPPEISEYVSKLDEMYEIEGYIDYSIKVFMSWMFLREHMSEICYVCINHFNYFKYIIKNLPEFTAVRFIFDKTNFNFSLLVCEKNDYENCV